MKCFKHCATWTSGEGGCPECEVEYRAQVLTDLRAQVFGIEAIQPKSVVKESLITAPDEDQLCTRCGELLSADSITWLELNCRTGQYSAAGATRLPSDESQGYFPFGPDCAKRPNKPPRYSK